MTDSSQIVKQGKNLTLGQFIGRTINVLDKFKPFIDCYKAITKPMGRLDSRVVFTLDLWTSVRYALGREFEPRWRQTLFRTQAQHLCFIHNSVWFVWFDTIICLSNLSCELWSGKLKIKEIYFKNKKSLQLL